jgi:DNA-binding MarR family transcriptional regulator
MAALDEQLKACGLAPPVRPGMGPVLFELLEQDDLTLSELSARARLAPSTITEITAKMVAAGLVRRRPDVQDGRASRLRLTPKARALRSRLSDLDRRLERVLAAELSAGEVTLLAGLLDRLRSALTEGRARRRRERSNANKLV